MLAKRRYLNLNNEVIARTPLLIPSFSSKGFAEVKKIIEFTSEYISGPTLVSAYDLHYQKIHGPFTFPSLIFLDSGGYEASKDFELSDYEQAEHTPEIWTRELHSAQIQAWQSDVPSVIISYDHPRLHLPYSEQIQHARQLPHPNGAFLREILLKPTTASRRFHDMRDLTAHVHELACFDVIGITEKELGSSIAERMRNIAQLRKALTRVGLETPIHVFGSLDTISTPMYFLAGADIFDGLTWLRFAFYEGSTIYKQNYSLLSNGPNQRAQDVDLHCWPNNLYRMADMEDQMRRFLNTQDYGAFGKHEGIFKSASLAVLETIGE